MKHKINLQSIYKRDDPDKLRYVNEDEKEDED